MRTTILRHAALAAPLLLASLLPAPRALRAQTAPCPAPAGAREEFADFFHRFQRDTAFQLSRVRFPLPWYAAADDATRKVPRAEWEFQGFDSGQETHTRLFDNFAMRLADSDERVWALIGTASDVRQNWFFRRTCGTWYLVRVEDLSM